MAKTCIRAIVVKVSLTKVCFKNDIDSNTPSIAAGPEAGTKEKKLTLTTIALVHLFNWLSTHCLRK